MPFYVYILKSDKTGRSYIGYTSDITKRLIEHNNGKSISTRYKGPWRLVHREEFADRAEAVARERYFKSQLGRIELKAKGLLS